MARKGASFPRVMKGAQWWGWGRDSRSERMASRSAEARPWPANKFHESLRRASSRGWEQPAALFYVDGELRFTDTRTDNPFHFGGEPNRWDTTGLAPGGHLVRFVVVDTAGMRAQAEVKVCVGDGSCALPGQPSPEVEEGGCGCGAAPVAPLAWLALGALALRRRRAREK